MKTYKSGAQETVFDVAISRYGSLDGLATLLADNPGLLSSGGDIEQFRVVHLVGDATAAPSELEKAPAITPGATPVIAQEPVYKSNGQQNVFDVALMQYGSVEGLAWLLADNKGLLQSGGTIQQFRVEHLVQTNRAVDARMKRKMLALVPTTEGAVDDAWITDPGQAWTTDGGQAWTTDNN